MTFVIAISAVCIGAIAGVVYLSKLFITQGREQFIRLANIAEDQQRFISKNINERVVYASPDAPYTSPVEETEHHDEDGELDEPEDIGPEVLAEIKNGGKK